MSFAFDPSVRSATRQAISQPFLLTDLGVRRSPDPQIFFDCHVSLNDPDLINDVNRIGCDPLLSVPIEQLDDELDVFVLLNGRYEVASGAVISRFDEVLDSERFRLQLFCGVLLAAVGDELSLRLLRKTESTARVATEKFTVIHRLAAARLKRFGDPQGAVRDLDRADALLAKSSDLMSDGDRSSLRAVSLNLRALALLAVGHVREAVAVLDRASESADFSELHAVDQTEHSRYEAQRAINRAQLTIDSGNTTQGVEILQQNAEYCELYAADYRSEALSSLAFALLLDGQFVDAVECSKRALRLIAGEASPSRLETTRKVQAAALAKLGRNEAARATLRRRSEDPLGLLELSSDV